MEGALVVFWLPKGTPLDGHRRFRKMIYGEDTSAQGGRYRYRRRGVLDEIPHILVYTGVVIIRPQYEKRLAKAIKGAGGTVFRRTVRLTPSDARSLGAPLS